MLGVPGSVLAVVNGVGFGLAALACLLTAGRLTGQRQSYGQSSAILIAAALLTSIWSAVAAIFGQHGTASLLAECLRNLAYLAAVYLLFAQTGHQNSLRPIRALVGVLALIEVLQPALVGLSVARNGALSATAFHVVALLRLLSTIGSLMLAHNLYVGTSSGLSSTLRRPVLAFAAIWVVELNHYTVAWLSDGPPEVLGSLRWIAALLFAALLYSGGQQGAASFRFRPSRTVAFQTASLLLIGCYLLILAATFHWLGLSEADRSGRFQIAFLAATVGVTMLTLPSRRIRGWLRVKLSKHFFQHRYDYREEWLRFTQTIGAERGEVLSLESRIVKAVADITDSPAGLLLTPDENGGLSLAARWEWPTADVPSEALSAKAVEAFERDGFIVDLDEQRSASVKRIGLPAWALDDHRAWAMVPLLHFDRLVGMVVVARPQFERQLDWEDLDLLRVVGQQLASFLAEHAGQAALVESARFDDFNRRIAFVMHDIKNLASQLGLLARNAEQHADNPAFRADMLVTLRNSADKLNSLLARLSRYGANGSDRLELMRADLMAARVVERLRAVHPVELVRSEECEVLANAEPFEQALTHLVQNAIDASNSGTPVFVSVACDAMNGVIEVIDSGVGMSPEFVRSKLFKPFVSTKQGGFGIGAYEARELIRAMGGRLDVESREGLGTRFAIRIPLKASSHLLESIDRQDRNAA